MPARPDASSLLTALGHPAEVDRLYQRLAGQHGRELLQVAESLGRAPSDLRADLAPLVAAGVVRIEDERVKVSSPLEVVSTLVARQADAVTRTRQELDGLAAALPFLAATAAGPAPGEVHDVEPLDGEVSSGGNVVALLTTLVSQSKGDLLWLRPDQWRLPREDWMAQVVGEQIAAGRRSRAIYPVRALHEAPDTLRLRAEVGEQIRVVPDLPTRMIVLGTTHAILPEPLGMADEPRTLVRQRGIVEALTLWFEVLWERAAPVPELDRGEARPDLRRFLLQQLAAGSQDEQIARTLGVSLRTVRRRIAAIMSDLGADTRFQAGVEAGRRGWL